MWLRYLILCCLCAALTQLLPGVWILAKAELAQVLIERSWMSGGRAKPWPWADTWPVLRLQVPHLRVDLFILEGGRGNALAFGPGRVHQYGARGGGLLIAGHRDTHFRFLQNLQVGDAIRLQSPRGAWQHWTVDSVSVVDSRLQALRPTERGLLLVTCYPFDALRAGGPLRFVISARRQ